MLNIGPQELILVLIIALVVVGPKRLPELGRTIGRGLREFRKIQDDVRDTLKVDLDPVRDAMKLDVDPDPEPPSKPVAKPILIRNTEPDDAHEVAKGAEVAAGPPSAAEHSSTADIEPESAD